VHGSISAFANKIFGARYVVRKLRLSREPSGLYNVSWMENTLEGEERELISPG
jgi:hypothetical protein